MTFTIFSLAFNVNQLKYVLFSYKKDFILYIFECTSIEMTLK